MSNHNNGVVLEVSGARRRFGATQALDGASLTLRRGEWLGLLGPNGAGKTTLIRSIAGRVRLDDGSVRLLGTPVLAGARATAAGKLAIVPQEIALYPLLTPAENLRAFGLWTGVPRAEIRQRIEWALEWTGLADRARERVGGFSGGMKRRLNIACSVLNEPDVVLLDEPTVGVDPHSRERIWEMLSELKKRGASLLLTTHQLDEAQLVCDRIVIIDHGRVIADGTLDELIARTVGSGRTVEMRLDRDWNGENLDTNVECRGDTLRCRLSDVAAELPPLLTRVQAAGARVEDLDVHSPTLQAVFLHLTGRELRE